MDGGDDMLFEIGVGCLLTAFLMAVWAVIRACV
jgi:hypothetical protein